MKRKKISSIPVQATAKSRRLHKMRGSRPAIQGRPRLGQKLRVQLTVGEGEEEDGGIVRHKLPAKNYKKGTGHSFSTSVAANKRSAKK